MIVDASALLAILKAEPEQQIFARALARSPETKISPVNWFEAALHAERSGDLEVLKALMDRARIKIASIDGTHAAIAFEAWRKFGKGRHQAALNLGDCFAYALAKALGEPLLYKGEDFVKTDIKAAV